MRLFDSISFGAGLAMLATVLLNMITPALGIVLTPVLGFVTGGLVLVAGAVWNHLNPEFLRAGLERGL